MMTAKIFENGRSQAVRLPKECRFSGEEVAVNKDRRYCDPDAEGKQMVRFFTQSEPVFRGFYV